MDKKDNILQNSTIPFIGFLIVIIGFTGTFISKQTALEVQLANIQKELVNISLKIDKGDEENKKILERLTKLEAK